MLILKHQADRWLSHLKAVDGVYSLSTGRPPWLGLKQTQKK